jgi:metal-sulfur cluster biosynthetic enzyme
MKREEILEILKKIYDPEHPLSVVDMGIVSEEDIEVNDEIKVRFKPTSPFCPMGALIGVAIKYGLEKALKREVEVTVKPGTHVNEDMVNSMMRDRRRYEEIVNKLISSGQMEKFVKI